MRVDVVLRYIGMVMLFIACFMLLSAGISWLGGMDSSFYPLLLSTLLTALLGAALLAEGILNLCVALSMVKIVSHQQPDVIEVTSFRVED